MLVSQQARRLAPKGPQSIEIARASHPSGHQRLKACRQEPPGRAAFGGDLEGVSRPRAARVWEMLLERLGQSGPGGHRGEGSPNHGRSDERIQEVVCNRLMNDPWLDASSIELAANLGGLRLSGRVVTTDQAR